MKLTNIFRNSKTSIFQNIKIFLFLVLTLTVSVVYPSDINEIKERSQTAFIDGDYKLANTLFSIICIQDNLNKNDKKYACRMKALLMEQYIGDIDSAIIIYNIYLKEHCSKQRELEITEKKLSFLNSLGEQKKSYGEYQRILFTNRDDLKRTKELDSFIQKYPNFVMRKEALKHCAIAGLNSQQYVTSYRTYKTIKNEYSPLSETEKEQFAMSKRMYKRYCYTIIVFVIWLIGALLFAHEIFNILKKRTMIKPSPLKTGAIVWFIILITYWIIYKVKIVNGDHNPFRVTDMLLMSIVFTIAILFNNIIQFSSHKRLYRVVVTTITTLSIIGTAYFSTYNRPDRINVMDDLYDQVGDIFIKDKNEKTGKNTQG